MENFQGDLTDVVRAGSAVHVATSSTPAAVPDSWPPSDHLPADVPSSSDGQNSFGDPFLTVGDPLLHNNKNNNIFVGSKIFEEDIIKRPENNNKINNNNFPRVKISRDIIIGEASASASPCNSPVMAVSSPVGSINANVIFNSNVISPKICNPLQISSPRSIGLKRRKNQAKKVVCIPAAAAANSKTSGEVVPSDLWAWRKYGQKPIKGSPYPRGYYRCSSTKGCPARKQVERSRSDPNMLVITYTSEHNHPWPTQRNALAGSTRSNPTKTPTSSNTSGSSRSSHSHPKEESIAVSSVKEEVLKLPETGNDDSGQLYMPDFQPSDDFFADLDELEGDSLSLLLTQGEDKQGIDPFGNFFDWSDEDKTDPNKGNM